MYLFPSPLSEWSPEAAELKTLLNLMHHLKGLGVKVVACQKVRWHTLSCLYVYV